MKKLLVFLTVLIVILYFSLVSFAYISDMTEITEMNIFVLEDFEGLSGAPSLPWADRSNFSCEYTDGTLLVKENLMFEEGYGYAKLDLFRNAPSSVDGIAGYGFYIENNTNHEITTRGYWIGCDAFIGYVGMPYYVMVDGVITEHYMGDANGEVYVQPGFKGYLLFPWESMNLGLWYGSDPMEVTYDTSKDWLSLAFTRWSADEGSVVLDNFILYGTTEMEGNTIQVSFSYGEEETPTDTPTDTPTEVPSEPATSTESTPIPTENATSEPGDVPTDIATPDGGNTGLIIGIVAGVIAVVAVVIIVLLGKRKSAK